LNIDVVGKFYLGNGGIGDALIFLSTFYDDVEDANVIFLANAPATVKELFDLFPKIKRKFVIQNDFHLLKEFYAHPNCIGTGILPKNLDYSTWYKVDIFKEYGVKEFPDFMNLFPAQREVEKQIVLQVAGSQVEGFGKQRMITSATREKILQEFKDYTILSIPLYGQRPLKEIFQTIRGSDLVIGVDSFAKTVSAMSKIKTIVYDNIYSPEYLARFKDGVDYGHYVFIFPWSYIEFRKQI
jgi:hypothetical protein